MFGNGFSNGFRLIGRAGSILLLAFLVGACASGNSTIQAQADQVRSESKEQILLNTANREQLITFYKQQLKENYSTETRIKLIEAYLESGDTESASFHLTEIESDEEHAAKIVFLKARVAYLSGNYLEAYQYAQTALSLSASYPEAENLMGLIQAERGELVSAREHFLSARRHYYDDAIIKNNLAVIDLIEENYRSAVQRLQPLYLKTGGDTQITSNLLIAYAKLGEYKAVREILKEQDYSEEDIQRIFLILRGMSKVNEKEEEPNQLPISQEGSAASIQVKVDRGPDYEAH
ncbi:hypothetical protein DI392_02905 [Vibrio albus]|uniref:Uncharacterized protein n=1 Tax=Vibrio albus TaxID=2200953 RepID=A0A2U3BEQ3_9VIBR|nr:hypothetical protein [Vibrio albus]PWI35232.1 hypothetical protein DI392_02905 [Vibrio albus]